MSSTEKPPERSSRARRNLHHLQFLTPNEVADRLLVAPVTVRQWAKRGLLPSETTPGGHRRFRERDVQEFIERRRQIQDHGARSPSRILIIDDDEQYTRTLSALLSARAPGLHIETAPDGFTAGIKCESLRPDIVTLDLQMPDMNGFEVCQLLRTMFGPDKPRIVVLSGFLSEENQRRVLAAGADSCVSKTAPMETLLRELGLAQATLAPPGES
jgi:excisionase family DNA binding protein